MNGKERICRYLNNEETDGIPIFPKISYATSLLAGVELEQYMSNGEALAKSIIFAQNKFGWDGVGIATDISLNGRALGSKYKYRSDGPCLLEEYLMKSLEDIHKIKVMDPWESEGFKVILKATKLISEEIGEKVFVQSWTNGPLNVASQLINMQVLMMDMIDEPELVKELLDICCLSSEAYVKELVKAGADAVAFGHACASTNMISRDMYEEFALPYEKRIVDAIHSEGGIAITHICGKIEPIVDLIALNGSDIIDFDTDNDIRKLIESTNNTKFFRGHISPTLLYGGTVKEIDKSIKQLIDEENKAKKLILGTGCEVPFGTPEKNLAQFMESGRKYGKRNK